MYYRIIYMSKYKWLQTFVLKVSVEHVRTLSPTSASLCHCKNQNKQNNTQDRIHMYILYMYNFTWLYFKLSCMLCDCTTTCVLGSFVVAVCFVLFFVLSSSADTSSWPQKQNKRKKKKSIDPDTITGAYLHWIYPEIKKIQCVTGLCYVGVHI